MQNTLVEMWKSYPNHLGYEISTMGKVRKNGRMLKTPCNCSGYPVCNIGHKNTKTVHSLVLETFVGPRPKGKCARHFNDIKTDNRLKNLIWGSRSENYYDALKNHGIKRFKKKLTEEQAKHIKYGTEHYSEVAERYSCSIWNIFKIRANVSWQEI